jgi:hypothetical protein
MVLTMASAFDSGDGRAYRSLIAPFAENADA